jgi:peptidoglycan/LPS O-acetylase OafA/YrhL
MQKIPPIPVLDGLRFIAVLLVLTAHSVSMLPAEILLPFSVALRSLSALGMSLFFTLSGFVIHYNYHAIANTEDKKQARRAFVVARFSRLYPLYALILLAVLVFRQPMQGWGNLDSGITLLRFLTFTQDWGYDSVQGKPMIFALGGWLAITWSISAEVFFYLVYLLIVPATAWLRSKNRHLLAAASLYLLYTGLFAFAYRHYDAGSNSYFFHWLTYLSPYSRLMEFLMGVIAANVYLHKSATKTAPAWLVGALLIAVHIASFLQGGFITFAACILYAPLTCYWIYCLACKDNVRLLSSKPMRKLGQASYSIYLLHGLWLAMVSDILEEFGLEFFGTITLVVSAMAAILLSSLVTYRYIEKPAQKTLRRWLS